MTIDIEYTYPDPVVDDYDTIIRTVVNEALDYEECPYEAQVYVLLTGDEEIHQINLDHRQIDRPTDVLSFPMNEYDKPGNFEPFAEDPDAFHPDTGELILGDIIISMDRVKAQALEYGHSLERELAFLTAHSMLHLMGYDHMVPEEQEDMEARQRDILNSCGYTRDPEAVYDLIVVGAGPAGMTAALYANGVLDRDGGEDTSLAPQILILESQEIPGRKILSTGNGHCNLTNLHKAPDSYRSGDMDLVKKILEQFDHRDTIAFMRQLGVDCREKNSYVYPKSDQASTVREAFEAAIASRANIRLKTGAEVEKLEKNESLFTLETRQGTYRGRNLVLACGGLAAGEKFGCTGAGYRMAESFGHRIKKPFPALTPLKSGAPFLKKLAGVRNQARVSLIIDGEPKAMERGELQWTDYGISGVAVFCLSRYAVEALNRDCLVSLELDLLPDMDRKETEAFFNDMGTGALTKDQPIRHILHGLLPAKLVPVVLREARIERENKMSDLTASDLESLQDAIHVFSLRINGYMGFDRAQVTGGGVRTSELDAGLQSRNCPGIFFAGEILDVDGTCGGYNLQWAFSSGAAAGRAVRQRLEEERER